MSKIQEIKALLSSLSTDELHHIERVITIPMKYEGLKNEQNK